MKTSDSGKSGRKSKPLIKNIYPANFFHIIAPFRILFFNNSRTISTTANTSTTDSSLQTNDKIRKLYISQNVYKLIGKK